MVVERARILPSNAACHAWQQCFAEPSELASLVTNRVFFLVVSTIFIVRERSIHWADSQQSLRRIGWFPAAMTRYLVRRE